MTPLESGILAAQALVEQRFHVQDAPVRYAFIQTEPEASIAAMRTKDGQPVGTYASWVTEMMGGVSPAITINVADNPHHLPETFNSYELVISGGASRMPEEMHPTVDATSHLLRLAELEEKEQLLVCFSHQVGLKTYGAQTEAHDIEFDIKDVYLTDEGLNDPLFEGFPRLFPAFKSHRRRVSSLPAQNEIEVVELATSAYPVEAVRTGKRRRSVQFHPELTAAVMDGLAVAKVDSGTLVLPTPDSVHTLIEGFYALGLEAQAYGRRMGENLTKHVVRQRSSVRSSR